VARTSLARGSIAVFDGATGGYAVWSSVPRWLRSREVAQLATTSEFDFRWLLIVVADVPAFAASFEPQIEE
jgi:hypothetical protein